VKDAFPILLCVLNYTVPSGGCFGYCYSIGLIFLFYKLAQWWWSKPTEYLKNKAGVSKVSEIFKAKHIVFFDYVTMIAISLTVQCL